MTLLEICMQPPTSPVPVVKYQQTNIVEENTVHESALSLLREQTCHPVLVDFLADTLEELVVVSRVSAGAGKYCRLLGAEDGRTAVYLDHRRMLLCLEPEDAQRVAAMTGLEIPERNPTTWKVRVMPEDLASAEVRAQVVEATRRAVERSAYGPVAAVPPEPDADEAVEPELLRTDDLVPFDLPCVAFRISRRWYEGMPEGELYEATRGWWRIGPRREQAPYAVAVAGGIVRAVYTVHEWVPYVDEEQSDLRWGFVGEIALDQAELVGVDVSHFFRAGAANPVSYLNLDASIPEPREQRAVPRGGTAPVAEALQDQLALLADNPALVLSLNSKELFHSNLLGWLVENNPAFGAAVLSPWLVPDSSRTRLRVLREKHHLDLIVELPGFTPLVIENKVFSLPDESQLLRYAEVNMPAAGFAEASRMLLSLLDPGWDDRTWQGWRWAPWTELIDRVAEHASLLAADDFTRTLVHHWIGLVRGLAAVSSLVAPSDPGQPLQLDGNTLEALEQLRLASVMQRFRTFAVKRLLEERLREAGLRVDLVETSFSNGAPLLGIKVDLTDGSRVGWQLQGGQWRRFVEAPDALAGKGAAKRAQRSDYVTLHHSTWLTFASEGRHGDFAPAPNANHKHFAPRFVYDYVRVPGITVGTLLLMGQDVASGALQYRDMTV